MDSFAAVISAWPSISDFASDVGVNNNVPPVWKHRNSIPGRYWHLVVAGAEKRKIDGITHQLLSNLDARQRAEKRAAAADARPAEGATA